MSDTYSSDPSSASEANPKGKKSWEREFLEDMLAASLKEKQRARRWRVFFKLCWISIVLLVIFLSWSNKNTRQTVDGPHTALVSLSGDIVPDSPASAENIIASLQAAFANPNSLAVILRANSPGGSPVQANMINSELRRLREEYPKKILLAVVEEVCASGCYLAVAPVKKIYVDQASLVGSIGVLYDGFGFDGTMKKLGIERRLLVAGENKGMFDPFSPERKEDRKHLTALLREVHGQFIEAVKRERGTLLGMKSAGAGVFTGQIYTGETSIELGLADGFGSVESVARDVVGAERIVDYTQKENILDRVTRHLTKAVVMSVTPTIARLR